MDGRPRPPQATIDTLLKRLGEAEDSLALQRDIGHNAKYDPLRPRTELHNVAHCVGILVQRGYDASEVIEPLTEVYESYCRLRAREMYDRRPPT